MAALTGDAILSALMEEPLYGMQTDSFLEALKPFVTQIPEVLGEMLNSQVDLKSLIKAKMAIIQFYLDRHFAEVCVSASSRNSSGLQPDELIVRFDAHYKLFLEMLKTLDGLDPNLLKITNLTATTYIKHEHGLPVKPEVLERIAQRNLTIAELPALQPLGLLFSNR